MREIKFRAWEESKKLMHDVAELHWCMGPKLDGKGIKFYGPGVGHGWVGENIELMQYTGLKDKNGKEIYEGDICIGGNLHLTGGFVLNNDQANVVRFVDGMFKLGSVSLVSFNKRTEVIGNIYETPELLEGVQCK